MSDLLKHYRRVHEQGFMPILVEDGRDARVEVEACVVAGMKAVEFTLRRRDSREMIPWIRRNYPELTLLVGSTIPDDAILADRRKKHPQLMTLEEIVDLDVRMKVYLEVMRKAREKTYPELQTAMKADDGVWLNALPHFHPF